MRRGGPPGAKGYTARDAVARSGASGAPSDPSAAMKILEIVYRYDAGSPAPRGRPGSPAAACARLERGNVDFAALIDRLAESERGVARQVVHIDPRELGVRSG